VTSAVANVGVRAARGDLGGDHRAQRDQQFAGGVVGPGDIQFQDADPVHAVHQRQPHGHPSDVG
jgi:hypothetical protein